MNSIYKIPGYILLLFGGFCLSWGGLIIRQFEQADVWGILLLRSFFFLLALIIFLLNTGNGLQTLYLKSSNIRY